MIARPHISSRCQDLLSRRSVLSTSQVVSISSQLKPHRPRIVPDDPEDDEDFQPLIKRPLKLSRRPLGLPKSVSEHPLGNLYGYTGQQLRENREKLSVDVLGETAEVIVLRDSKINNYHNNRYEEDVETQQDVDILAQLDQERGLVGWKEVVENINEWRPTDGSRPQTRAQFSELLTGLQNGFTVSQLAKYLQTYGGKALADHGPITASPALRISPWIPGTSKSEERLDGDHLRGYDLQSYTTKQRLALRILRQCWNVELLSIEEGTGQIEIEVKPSDLDLFLNGKTPALSEIHSKYILETDERLEVFKSNDAKRTRNAIRITSTRSKSHMIVQAIEEKLKGIHRIQLPLKVLMPQSKQGEQSDFKKWANTHFDELVVGELARLTDTVIRKTSRGSLLIASIDPNTGTAFSTRSDVARRLATTSGKFSDRDLSWVGCQNIPDAAKGMFVKYQFTEGLGWRDRLHQWCRWVTPISKHAEVVEKGIQTPDESGPILEVQPFVSSGKEIKDEVGTSAFGKREQRRADTAFWSDEISVQSSALLGAVIYAHCKTRPKDSQQAPSFSDSFRAFSTAIPGISRLLVTAMTSNTRATESVIMRFLPNPFFSPSPKQTPIGAAALSAFPPIEMRFAVDPESKVMGLNTIHAIHSTENSDLMLPDSPMDIRFQQKLTSRFYGAKRSLPQGIAKFLELSNLNLDYTRGGLQTPPSLSIPISAHLCTKDAFQLLGSEKNDGDTQDVEYLFAGLEIRRTVAMEFKGWRLLYTSVEAGKAGGRRGELRLRPARVVESEDPGLETEKAFLETAFQLADASYSPVKSRRVREKLIRKVEMYKDRDVVDADRTFRYFAKRPTVSMEWRRGFKDLDEETGEELLDRNQEA